MLLASTFERCADVHSLIHLEHINKVLFNFTDDSTSVAWLCCGEMLFTTNFERCADVTSLIHMEHINKMTVF